MLQQKHRRKAVNLQPSFAPIICFTCSSCFCIESQIYPASGCCLVHAQPNNGHHGCPFSVGWLIEGSWKKQSVGTSKWQVNIYILWISGISLVWYTKPTPIFFSKWQHIDGQPLSFPPSQHAMSSASQDVGLLVLLTCYSKQFLGLRKRPWISFFKKIQSRIEAFFLHPCWLVCCKELYYLIYL